MNELFSLKGKIALVTGGSRGLGRAMALGLAHADAKVAVADLLDVSETVNEIKKTGHESIGIKVDVSNKTDVTTMIQAVVKQFGKCDILVNNAGIIRSAAAESMDEKDWNAVININLTGEFLCAQAAGKQMIQQKSGKIINIASVAGQFASAQSAAYSASKAGVILLTKTLALEWAKHNINVNAICPGVFVTSMTDPYLKDEQFKQMITTRVPLGRPAVPQELVGTVVYLASKASDYMTGHALVIDGGWTAGL
jgi:2-deoxy-D-gluconate 3-dehydrogenase